MTTSKISEIKRRISYSETLMSMDIGSTQNFKIQGTIYNTMRNAGCRLKKKGYLFSFKTDKDNNILIVTRIS